MGIAWFARTDPLAPERLTLKAKTPHGDRYFDVRLDTSQLQGQVDLQVQEAQISSNGRFVVGTFGITFGIDKTNYLTATQVFDLDGGRSGLLEAGAQRRFTENGEALVYQDTDGRLSFLGATADATWTSDGDEGVLLAEKKFAANGWGWWTSAADAPVVLAYDRAAARLRVFDYSDLANGHVR
ncbi:MAG: hypothetical protein ACPHRO_16015, partial [Nannocystaceae bacterium]